MAQVITDLTTYKRNSGRVCLYLNDRYAFTVKLLDSAGLKKGQALDDNRISELKTKHDRYQAYSRAIYYISYRPRSRQEVERYLAGKGFRVEIIANTVERLAGENHLNDEEFARLWISSRKRHKPKSRSVLRYELLQKGIAPETIEAVLVDIDDNEMARIIVEKRLHRWTRLSREELKKKIINYLKTHGFNYEASMNAYRHVCSETFTNHYKR